MGGIISKSGGEISHGAPSSSRPAVAVGKYEETDAVGFERLPETLRSNLRCHLIGAHLCSAAEDAVTLRRPDGSAYQRQHAWWVSRDAFISIDATRDLCALDDGRFAPAGQWNAEIVTYPLSEVEEGTKRYSRRSRSGQAEDGLPGGEHVVSDPLDLLPGPARQWIGDVEYAEAWTLTTAGPRSGKVEETVVAYRIDGPCLLALSALRESEDKHHLPLADWRITTLQAALSSPSHARIASPPTVLAKKRVRSIGSGVLRALGTGR